MSKQISLSLEIYKYPTYLVYLLSYIILKFPAYIGFKFNRH